MKTSNLTMLNELCQEDSKEYFSSLTREKFDARVKLKIKYDKAMPFEGLPAREAMATVWSYVGWKFQVVDILQKLSHQSRAYLYNGHGLSGFLVELNVIPVLKRLESKGKLDEISPWQRVDIEEISNELNIYNKFNNHMLVLSTSYPALYIYFLELKGEDKKAKIYK